MPIRYAPVRASAAVIADAADIGDIFTLRLTAVMLVAEAREGR